MVTLGRAMKIIALLFGFYLMCLLLIAGLIVADYYAFQITDRFNGAARILAVLVLATVGVIVLLLRGLFVSTRTRKKHLPGIPVTRAEQPVLWQRVIDLSAAAQTRAPSEIRLVPEVNAAVSEHSHLLGALPGKRRMYIGIPLMQALTMPQFDSVIGHELGHYSGSHSRLGPLANRARATVVASVQAIHGRRDKPKRFEWPGSAIYAQLFEAYAELVLAQTFAISRQQELDADTFAASIGGRRNAAAALHELPAIDTAYGFYLGRYVEAGLSSNLLPPAPEVLGGFIRFVTDPSRSAEISELRDEAPDEKAHRFDSHPPTADRIKAILALPDDGRPLDEGGPRAFALLHQPAGILAALGTKMVGKHAVGKQVADWDTIARTVRRESAREVSKPLVTMLASMLGRPVRIADFLAVVDSGGLGKILGRIEPSEAAKKVNATGPTMREFAKTSLGRMLAGWVLLDLIDRGRVAVRHSWSNVSGELVMSDELDDALENGIEALLTMWPDTAPLKAVTA